MFHFEENLINSLSAKTKTRLYNEPLKWAVMHTTTRYIDAFGNIVPTHAVKTNYHVWNYVIGEDCVGAEFHCWVQVNLIGFRYSLATRCCCWFPHSLRLDFCVV